MLSPSASSNVRQLGTALNPSHNRFPGMSEYMRTKTNHTVLEGSANRLSTPGGRAEAGAEFDRHLELIGGFCSLQECPICGHPAIREDTQRLRLARLEYESKFCPLPKIVRDCLCIYCGDLPSDRDHLLPKTWTGTAVRKYVPTVPACRSCNGIRSDFPSPIIASRAEHLKDVLGRRWARRLQNNPSLDGLTGNLRKQIAANNFQRNVMRGRLIVLTNGGVPEIPPALQGQLVSSGPASLVSDITDVQPPTTMTAQHPRRYRTSSRASLPKACVVQTTGTATPGAAYMARTS